MRVVPLLWAVLFASLVRAEPVDFVRDVQPIFRAHCYSCHGSEKQKSGLRLDIRSELLRGGDNYGPALIAKQAADSPVWQLVTSTDPSTQMPPEGPRLTAQQIATLTDWINQGAHWPDGADDARLEDKRDHWSFRPLTNPSVPTVSIAAWPRNTIDQFVMARLDQAKLHPAPEADRVSWLRRVTLDLTGLPPTPQEVSAFARDLDHQAYERVVDRLLASPRYGERWAQHWLDVVRYADTHGFEVNTERPHAWPYRDYVIDALNRDTPYDHFVREQIAGDQLKQDSATGFLITASVLLPGQIGADEPSKRLARQDSLDEIVVNISQSFLGLSVGCARCHDHKFDPVSQQEYYALQAFVAGVEYADRDVRTPAALALKQEEIALKSEIEGINQQLSQLEPLARVEAITGRETSAQLHEETFEPRAVRYVRFTIHDANLHPTLGLIEPCIDEFEILTDEPTPRNVALASQGTRVSASGSRTSEIHKLEHIHDGLYGNSHSWMSSEAGRGWVQFELPQLERVGKVLWSRDREGKFSDRLPTAFTLEAGPSLDQMMTVVSQGVCRAPVNARRNTDRISPVTTRRIRFTIEATNNLEPCLDELEVWDTSGQNIALASAGAQVTSSGDNVTPDRHELRFLNDGVYGNSHSWMSSETGKGWVVVEFPQTKSIERIVWGRDRPGKFVDRLPTEYRIEVADASNEWQLVAGSMDRRPYLPAEMSAAGFSTSGLSPEEVTRANVLMERKKLLEQQATMAAEGQKAFAGKFRDPDPIHRLHRGDPEQPKEPVAPAVPTVLGTLTLAADTGEPERRIALANWIASPENPLTARVMVNRIWQGHFGTGIVETASDFGRTGTKPSHPELLDWLAGEFLRQGWSVKAVHRLIVLSATYRQSTQYQEDAAAQDADIRMLWRFPSRRLEAETIRDAMLSVNGQLNLKMGGRGFNLFNQRGGLSGFNPVESFQGDGLRRMIYAHKVRREREAVFGAFDCPDAGQSTARRRESTTPIQALNLFNSQFTIDQSVALADRLKKESGDDPTAQIRQTYLWMVSREPETEELTEAAAVVQQYGLASLCRALYNSNEFLFLP